MGWLLVVLFVVCLGITSSGGVCFLWGFVVWWWAEWLCLLHEIGPPMAGSSRPAFFFWLLAVRSSLP